VGEVLNRSSRTAEHVALFRAIETARRRDRVIDDPYAVAFLTGRYGLLARLARMPAVGRWLESYLDRRFPGGPRASAVARTRLIDELVEDALGGDGFGGDALGGGAAGTQAAGTTPAQVVLLGAGYDSRAYRLPATRSARVFEVDHPATQATKRRVVGAAVRAERRAHVRFVGVDLMRDDLAGALRAAGFSGEERAVVVWEGATNYLNAESVDVTLRALAGIAASGSRIVFTYVDRAALDGTGDFRGVWQDAVRRQGEPWTFGFVPEELPGYLAERGLRLGLDLSTRDAADRSLVPLGRHEPAAAFYRIAQAEVR
jgi:methyltransferase (TIGR00027 family)